MSRGDGQDREPPDSVPPRSPESPSEDGNFAEMLEHSLEVRSFQQGETVEGVVVAIWPDVALVDVGAKGEASIDVEEFRDPEGDLDIDVGDRIEAVVVSTEGGLKLSHKLARSAAARQRLSDAYRAGLAVEGRVEKAIKGGYEVRIAGQRAFCPISQIDVVRTEDASIHEGRVYDFRIREYEDDGKELIVSRRVILEEEQQRQAEEVRRAIVAGAVLPGRVVSVLEYGAFVDLGAGVQGLLHVSEMGWSRSSSPSEIVQPGDEIRVKVLRVDETGKIALGLKQLQPDPWSRAAETYAAGQVRTGRITRLAGFGAFVELEPGIEALAHVSTFPPTGTPDGWKASVPPGTRGAFEILSVDFEKRRIGVAMLEEGSVRAESARAAGGAEARGGRPDIVPGARLVGKVERHERFGVFVFLAPGRTGLVPASETGVERESDLRKVLPVGGEVEVIVLETDAAGRRIRLSRKAVFAADERREARDYAERQQRQEAEGFGSLADKLRDAMRRRDP